MNICDSFFQEHLFKLNEESKKKMSSELEEAVNKIARLKIQIEEQVKFANIHDLKKFKLIKI